MFALFTSKHAIKSLPLLLISILFLHILLYFVQHVKTIKHHMKQNIGRMLGSLCPLQVLTI